MEVSESAATDPPEITLPAARQAGARALKATLVLRVLATIARLGFAGAAAVTIGVLVMESKLATTPFWSALALLLAAQAVTSLAERSAVDAEAHVAAALRRKIIERLAAMPARAVQTIPVGEAIIGLQRQVEAVAALTISHKAASVMMGVGPLLAAIALFLVSWQAAALMLL
ncbi:ABC transporter, partial [Salmonella enterica subsp. enterica serovar Virchow]|nr:ABC transporter [Salmonella enterica subsp. enterica serovar Virchow]